MEKNLKESAEILKKTFGENPKKVILYSISDGISKSGMSEMVKVIAIKNDDPIIIFYDRVYGYGLDRGFEICRRIFNIAYPNLKYTEKLIHRWL